MRAVTVGGARVPVWAVALVLVVVAAPTVLFVMRSGRHREESARGSVVPENLRPVVVAEKDLPIAVPFDSHPFSLFTPKRLVESRVARYPLEEAYDQAAMLDVPFPSTLKWAVCEGALFHNRLWQDGYVVNMTCGHPRPPAGSPLAVVERDLAVGYDPAHISFQHDMITGLSHASFFVKWAQQQPTKRGILCHKVVCEILKAVHPGVPMERGPMAKLFWAPSVRYVRAPGDTTMDGCEPYPLGSFWPVEVFLRQVLRAGRMKMPAKDVPRILYLSRGTKSTSIRWLDNEEQFVERLRSFAKERGWKVDVVPHETVAVSVATTNAKTISQFFTAAAVVGLHGGAFSNIVFCHQRAVILELNNNLKVSAPPWSCHV